MKRIGLHIWIRETRNYRPLIRDSIEKGYRIRQPYSASSFSGGWREPIVACAYRYCRMYGLDRLSDWYDVCRRLCDMWSGNPRQTLDSVFPDGLRHRRQHRRLYLKGDVPKWLKPHLLEPNGHREKYGCVFAWSRLHWDAKFRLKAWHEWRAERERRKESTCIRCGAFEMPHSGFLGVRPRIDCTLPANKMFGWKRLPALQRDQLESISHTERTARKAEVDEYMEKYALGPRLCVPCYNKERWIYKKAREIASLQKQINQTQKELRNGRKEHHQQHPGNPR